MTCLEDQLANVSRARRIRYSPRLLHIHAARVLRRMLWDTGLADAELGENSDTDRGQTEWEADR